MQKRELSHICKTCGFAMPFTYRGRRISEKEIEELYTAKKTNWRSGWDKKDAKGTLDGRLILQENTLAFEAKTLSAKCPKCKSAIYKDGTKWRCSGNDCDFVLTQTLYGRKFNETETEKLLAFGYSDEFDDFVSAKGKYYRGFVEISDFFALKMNFL
ncbi:MAG: hypothetical protein FWE23_04640 [Chitinivibrionia bacterium]|nr:hypothetical protein [Chitinivibrionia bacterium]